MARTLRLLLSVSALLGLLATVSQGQDYRGRIQGTITDPSQAVVPGATVTLANVNTGVTAVRKSNDSGHYLFDLVEPGIYNVNVEAVGFSKFLRKEISLPTRGDLTVDAVAQSWDRPGDRHGVSRGDTGAIQYSQAGNNRR